MFRSSIKAGTTWLTGWGAGHYWDIDGRCFTGVGQRLMLNRGFFFRRETEVVMEGRRRGAVTGGGTELGRPLREARHCHLTVMGTGQAHEAK